MHMGMFQQHTQVALRQIISVSQIMQRAQNFEVRAQQILLTTLAGLPGSQHSIIHREQRQQIIALLC